MKATVAEGKLTMKEMVRLITELSEEISAANISHWKKDEMRNGELELLTSLMYFCDHCYFLK